MKKRSRLIALFAFFLLKFSVSFAQVDTVFWFAAPWVTPDHTWRDPYKMHIAGKPNTTVRVWQPAATPPNKYDTTFMLGASGYQDVVFWRDAAAGATEMAYDSLEVRPANTVVPYGLKVLSDSNITVVYDVVTRSPSWLNPETFSLKGQNGIGKEFVCPFQTKWYSVTLGGDVNGDGLVTQPKQQINIVATKPNTTVWITPRCPIIGHAANVTFSVFLPFPGSAYTAQNVASNTNVSGNNLSGSIVTSDKDIAVTVADDSVHGLTGCYDLMGDQIVPVDIVGKEYIVLKGKMNAGEPEGAEIVGTANFTQININDGGVTTSTIINKGETFHYSTSSGITYILANKNVYVLHATGFGCELGEALLPPMDCGGSNDVRFSRNNTQRYFLNILCKTAITNSFVLNGSPTLVPASAFTIVPGTGGLYSGAQIEYSLAQVPVSSATFCNLLSNTYTGSVFSLGVYNGSLSTGNMYHYMSLFYRKTVIDATTLTPICFGETPSVAISGTLSGGVSLGTWTTSNGTGTLLPSGVNTANYSFGPGDALLDTIYFTLTSNPDCKFLTVNKTIKLKINKPPTVAVGSGTTVCKNNIPAGGIPLTGTVTNGVGAWSGGGGSYTPPNAVNTFYHPSPSDLASNSITLTLTGSSTVGCVTQPSGTVVINFTDPPAISAGPSTVVCTNSQSLALNGSIAGYTVGSWNTTGTGGFVLGNAALTNTYLLSPSDLTLTSLTFSLTYLPVAPDNCAAQTSIFQMNIIPKPAMTATAPPLWCANAGPISLTGNVSGATTTGSWSTTNGSGAFTQLPPSNASYTLSQNDTLNGSVTFILNSTGGICPSVSDTVMVPILKTPVVTTSSDVAVCRNAPISFTGNVSGYTQSGIWTSSGTGLFSPHDTDLVGQYFPSPGDIANGSVTLTLHSNHNICPQSKSSFVASFVPAPKAQFIIPAIRCQNTPIVFTDNSQANGTSNLGYSWNFGEGPGSISSGTNPIYTYTNAGSYVVTFTVTGTSSLSVSCPDTTSRRVTIYATPLADFNILNACQGMGTGFTDNSIVPNGNVTSWSWQFGDGGTSAVRNPTHTFVNSGSFYVTLQATSNYSCISAPISKSVTVNPKPTAKFGMTNNPTVAQEPVYFSDFSTPTGGIVNWTWHFGDASTEYGSNANPTHAYPDAGTYTITLTVSDGNGCSDSTSRTIEVQLLPQVPTAFTPNGDNNNDLLFVKGGPFASMKFRVYDSWGVMVFETSDQTVGWDGKKNGVEQPVGVYVWTLVADMYNNRQVKKNGDVTIIR